MAIETAELHQVVSQTTIDATRATAIPAMGATSIFIHQAPLAVPVDGGDGGAGVGVVTFPVVLDVVLAVAVGGVGVGGVGVGGVGVGGVGVGAVALVALLPDWRRRILAPVKSHFG